MTVPQYYFRAPLPLSPNAPSHAPDQKRAGRLPKAARASAALAALAALCVVLPAVAQYPGQVSDKSKDDAPTLRAVGVLEWTGEPGKPTASRLVPITVYDGQQLQDGGLYLSRPEPIAVFGETEYELKQEGKTIGLFDIRSNGHVQGSWAGFGDWRPIPKPQTEAAVPAKIEDDEGDDKPVLHRKNHSDASAKKTDDKQQTKASPQSGDTDHPTLHKKTDDKSDSADLPTDTTPVDPDRPVMKKPKPKPEPAEAPLDADNDVSSLRGVTDPDRPRLKRGKSTGSLVKVTPTLMGLPPDMQQAVAVSDPKNRPDHPWTYTWANPQDQDKMKAQMEDIARQALGIAQPAPPPAPAKHTGTRRKAAAKQPPPPPPPPVPLEDEQFRVFELAYGSGATLVLTAHTDGALADQKFVTLIAQPDLYGNILVLLKHVTDGAHLDDNPRMRLIDAVDALADNRGELLFELRGATMRQFALYRVLRGQADKLFVTFGGSFGSAASD